MSLRTIGYASKGTATFLWQKRNEMKGTRSVIWMIPRVIHYCWFGEAKKSKLVEHCLQSWRRVLPDYDIKEWNEYNFDISINRYCREAYECGKWAFVSDFVRLYVLYQYGGIYLDTDVEVLKPLDQFLGHAAFSGFEDREHIPTGIMGAQAGNKWIENCLPTTEIVLL